jgi:hypothetical protein
MVGNSLLSPPIPSRKGADPHRDDLIRMPDRGRRPITRSDQDTMGLPDDLLVPSPQVRPVIEHQFPNLVRRRRAPMASPPGARRWRDEGAGARVQLLVGVVTDLLVRDVDEAAGIFAMWPGV